MKRIIFILLLFFGISSCVLQKITGNIHNRKTDRHINIPSTRLYIIPPPGFKIAKTFTGLHKGSSYSILIFDLIGGNFYTNAATFNKENFEEKGYKVFEYKELKINGYPAKYIYFQGNPTTKSISLVFGDTTFSTSIVSTFPSQDVETGEQIKKALKTIYYDKNIKIDPFETAEFTLDDSKSIFKFSKFTGGMYIYTVNGEDNDSAWRPLVIISTIPKTSPNLNAKSVIESMISNVKKYGLTDKEIKNDSILNINGYQAYEVEIYGKMKGKDVMVYLLTVMGEDKAIGLEGMTASDFDYYLQEIKKLAKTIKLK